MDKRRPSQNKQHNDEVNKHGKKRTNSICASKTNI